MKSLKDYSMCTRPDDCDDCTKIEMCNAWRKFVCVHRETKAYAHFDKRVALEMNSVRAYVLNPDKISKHSFYPFIHFTKRTKKMRHGKGIKPKTRELYYCCHLDRCVYQRYAFLINYEYNRASKNLGINNVAIAYRDNLGKNSVGFAKDAFAAIRRMENCFVMVGDFSEFFDNLDHKYLKKQLVNLLGVRTLPPDYYAVYKNITHFSSMDWNDIVELSGAHITDRGIRTKLNSQDIILEKPQFQQGISHIKLHKEKGIPQGSPISSVLSNVYMMGFDVAINKFVDGYHGVYMRYSDDFLIILPDVDDAYTELQEILMHEVENVGGLTLHPDKTSAYRHINGKIHDYTTGEQSAIDYLGFIFDGTRTKMRPRAISKYYYRMRRKARTIGSANWKSPSNKRITAKQLYQIYSSNSNDRQTFIDYGKKARRELELEDHELDSLIDKHKHKIHMAIKKAMV